VLAANKAAPQNEAHSRAHLIVKPKSRGARAPLTLNAFAVTLLTLLGAAGEALGYDRHLKSNTSKRRTHSLFRQGSMLYDLMVTMPDERLRPLIERFDAMLRELPVFERVYGVV
jgi:hypothetical protein